jgi:myo-inositol-1(or 4)-monophosphatase
VREAGGFTGPIREGAGIFERGEVIAANAEIFDRFAKVIRTRRTQG